MNESNTFPIVVSKAQIAQACRCSRKTLREKIFTREWVESNLGMSFEDFKKIRLFDHIQSQRIIELLKLTPDLFS